MADFNTHISLSTAAGAFYGVGGYQAGLPWESCVIGGSLCSVSGMLPDLDSDSGIPLREAKDVPHTAAQWVESLRTMW